MRKSLLKSLVGVAVLGATMAITSVAAMAATTFNFPSGMDAVGYDFAGVTNGTTTGTDNTSTTSGKGAAGGSINAEETFSSTGVTFTAKDVMMKCDAVKDSDIVTKDKARIKIPVKAGDTVYVYGCSNTADNGTGAILNGVDASSADKLMGYAIFNGKVKNDEGNNVCAPLTELKVTIPDTFTGDSVYFVSFNVNDSNNTTYPKSSCNVAAIVVVSPAAASATLTEGSFPANYGTVVVKGTDAYLIGEYTLNSTGTLSIGDQTFTTDTVYKSVQLAGDTNPLAAEKDGTYYYAVKVTDLTSNDQVAALMNFTVA